MGKLLLMLIALTLAVPETGYAQWCSATAGNCGRDNKTMDIVPNEGTSAATLDFMNGIGGAGTDLARLAPALSAPTGAPSVPESSGWTSLTGGDSLFDFKGEISTNSISIPVRGVGLSAGIDPRRGLTTAQRMSVNVEVPVVELGLLSINVATQFATDTGSLKSVGISFSGPPGTGAVGAGANFDPPGPYGSIQLFNVEARGTMTTGQGAYNATGNLVKEIYQLYGAPF